MDSNIVNFYTEDGKEAKIKVDGDSFTLELGDEHTIERVEKFPRKDLIPLSTSLLSLADKEEIVKNASKEEMESVKNLMAEIIGRESQRIDQVKVDKMKNMGMEELAQKLSDGVEKLEEANSKEEVLDYIYGRFGANKFTAREFKEYYPFFDESSQRWLQRLKNQGFLNNQKAEEDDGRINYTYQLSNKGLSYLQHKLEE